MVIQDVCTPEQADETFMILRRQKNINISLPYSRPKYRIRHMLPGRVRFFMPVLHGSGDLIVHYEEEYRKIKGISEVKGNHITGTLLIVYDPSRLTLAKILYVLYQMNGIKRSVRQISTARTCHAQPTDAHSLRRQFTGIAVAGSILGLLVFQRFLSRWFPFLGRFPVTLLASVTAVFTGIPVFREGLEDVLENKRISLDLMVSIASVIAIFMGEGLVALEVVWLMNCGTFLEDFTAERSRRAIRKLLDVGDEHAWVLKNGITTRVALEEVKPDDIVVAHGGEKVLVDGEVIGGQAAVNQAPITGESIPVEKLKGESAFAGTIVTSGTIYIKAAKVGDETYLSRVLHMVEESLETRAPIESISDRFATWFVPSAFLLSLLVFAVTRNFYRAFTVLVTACPCAAAIATPTAISAAVGNAAKRNMLVKGGIFIEQASRIDTICLDKTGTVTEGRPVVVSVLQTDERYAPDDIVVLAASAEARSPHPLARALVEGAELRGVKVIDAVHFETITGSGVVAELTDRRRVLVGSERLMRQHNIAVEGIDGEASRMRGAGETLLYVAVENELAGLIGVVDRPRQEAQSVIYELQQSGISVYLLTGDHQKTADAVSRQLGINNYYYDMLPEDKGRMIEKLRAEGRVIAMVGDGVNDALALAKSDLGIAMGAGGSDVAVEAADIALKSNDLTRLPAVRELSQKTMSVIKQNYVYSMVINALGIGLGSAGVISPLMGGVLHVINSLGVILNSSRILLIRDK